MCTIEGKLNIDGGKHVLALCTYQCKPRGGGGGVRIKFLRVGNKRSIKSVKKAPTPGEKI